MRRNRRELSEDDGDRSSLFWRIIEYPQFMLFGIAVTLILSWLVYGIYHWFLK